jgi:hypothetical protein
MEPTEILEEDTALTEEPADEETAGEDPVEDETAEDDPVEEDPADEDPAEDEIAEEAEAAEEERKFSRFSRGCLEVAGLFAGLAALLLLFEQIGICFAYELPQLCLPLTLAGGSLLALTVCLFSAMRKALASFVLIVTIWFLILVYAVTNFQFPEVIPTTLPHTEKQVVLTQITTPLNANLCVDEILIPGVVCKRFKLPVHPKYIPLHYQVQLLWNEETSQNELYYNDLLWATYDPSRKRWKNAVSVGSIVEYTTEPPETAPMTRKPHHTGRNGSSTTTTTTTTTTVKAR